MKKIIFNRKLNFIFIFSLIIPVIFHLFNFSGDGLFHFSRIIGLTESIKNLDLYPDLTYNLYKNMDYISPTFYNLIVYYPVSILYLLTKNFLISFGTYIILLQLISTYTGYYIFDKISNIKNTYFILILYLNNPYRYSLILTGRYSELIATIPILFGLYYFLKILNSNYIKKDLIYFIIATSATIVIHLISGLILITTYIIILIFNYKKINREFIINIFSCSVISIFLISFFLYPIILNFIKNELVVENIKLVNLSESFNLKKYMYTIIDIFLINPLGQANSIFLFILFLFSCKYTSKNKLGWVIFSYIFLLPILSYLKIFDNTILNNIQFLKRFNGVISMLILFKIANYDDFIFYKIKNILKLCAEMSIIILIIYLPITIKYFNQSINNTDLSVYKLSNNFKILNYNDILKNNQILSFGFGGEYVYYNKKLNPKIEKVDFKLMESYVSKIKSDLIVSNEISYTEQSGYNKYKVSIQNPKKLTTTIIIPKFNYYGYQVYVNGVKTKTTQSKYGTIQLNNIKDKEINISVKYEKPKSIYISYLVSAITMLGLGIYYKKIRDC